MRRLLATALLAVAVVAGSLATAAGASAHATRIATDPAENAQLTESPATVAATFNEAMQPQFAAMTVVGPDDNLWSTGEPKVEGAVVSVGVRPLGPAGTYTVNYRATSADGHVISGSWAFELTAAGTGTPGPPATAADDAGDDGFPMWPLYVGVVVIVGGAVLWAVRRRT
ncbi:copper resistance CopC family protein [Mycolicibacterium sp. XJ662]